MLCALYTYKHICLELFQSRICMDLKIQNSFTIFCVVNLKWDLIQNYACKHLSPHLCGEKKKSLFLGLLRWCIPVFSSMYDLLLSVLCDFITSAILTNLKVLSNDIVFVCKINLSIHIIYTSLNSINMAVLKLRCSIQLSQLALTFYTV